jgi:hypothetical protein
LSRMREKSRRVGLRVVGDQPWEWEWEWTARQPASTGNIHRRGNRRPKRLPFGPGSELIHISS